MLGLVAALLQTVAYLDYNQKVLRGETKPNGATWLIWASLAGLNASSYLVMTSRELATALLPLINTLLCIGTFFLALRLRKFDWPDLWDWLALATGLISAVTWWQYQSAVSANMILQFAIFLGFIPTYRLVWRDPQAERPRPWWIWVGAYCVLTITVIVCWKNQWQDLGYPVNCLVLHSLVPGIAFASFKLRVK
ncbi:MAG: hypothetical protein WC640_01370 [Candidatus Paceibacterota bacterium]